LDDVIACFHNLCEHTGEQLIEHVWMWCVSCMKLRWEIVMTWSLWHLVLITAMDTNTSTSHQT